VVRLALNLIPFYAKLSEPFIPGSSRDLLAAMQIEDILWPEANDEAQLVNALTTLNPGHAFTVPDNLFRKITDDERADWAERFAGTRG